MAKQGGAPQSKGSARQRYAMHSKGMALLGTAKAMRGTARHSKGNAWQRYVMHSKGMVSRCTAKARRGAARHSKGKARRGKAKQRHGEAWRGKGKVRIGSATATTNERNKKMAEEKKTRNVNYFVIDLQGGEKNVKFDNKAQFVKWLDDNTPKGVASITKTGALKTDDGGTFMAFFGRPVIPQKAVTIRL